MYKCKECGLEYKEKPDYCECGNDEFEEEVIEINLAPKEEEEQVAEKEPEPVVIPQPKTINHGFISQNKINKETQYSPFSRITKAVDPVSGIIFLLCLILSAYVIFFAWNPEETTIAETPKNEQVVNKNIPSVDKFWNNALPVVKQEQKKEEPKEEPKIVEEVKKIIQPITKQEQKKVVSKPVQQKATTPKTTTVKQSKTTSTQQKQTPVQQTTTQSVKTTTQQPAKTENKPVTQPVTTTPQKTDAQIAAEKAAAAQKAAQQQQEFVNYKAKLRNTIGKKIDFTQVVGDGGCTVAFKIDSSGKLVSRSFAQQSSNITLNDAVYKAVMATPTYTPPPAAYKNETLNLIIRFYDGNYEITLR